MTSKPAITFFASHAGGGVRMVHTNIAEALAAQGYACELRAMYPSASEPPQGAALEWHYLLGHAPRGGADAVRMVARLARWLRRARPAVVVSAQPAANVLVAVLARLFSPQTRVVLTYHETTEFYRPVLALINPWCARLGNVRAVVAVSRAVVASLGSVPQAFTRKLQVITNALPPGIEALCDRLGAARQGRVAGRKVISVVRLSPEKNVEALIEAAAVEDARFEVVIYGRGPHEAALRARAEALGVAGRITFAGQLPREEVLARVAQCDVFAQMSLVEGHSLALIEAGRIGLPLVVSDVASQREGVSAADGSLCGLVLPPHDPAMLAAALNRLLDDPAAYAHAGDDAMRLARANHFATQLGRYRALIDAVLAPSR